jgi:GxxExxY protein
MNEDSQTYAIIGAAMEVHRELGAGFLEAVYQRALEVELRLREIPYRTQVELPVHYKNKLLDCKYRADFLCYEAVILELKSIEKTRSLGVGANHQLPQSYRANNWVIAQLQIREPRVPPRRVSPVF